MDTLQFSRGVTPLDIEMFAFLLPLCDQEKLLHLERNNMEFTDLKAYGAAIDSIRLYGKEGICFIPFACPDALIASISDFILSLEEVDIASSMIRNEAADDANVIFGVAFDPDMEDKMKITIVATGFENKKEDGIAPEETAEASAAGEDEKKTEDVIGSDAASISDDEFNEIISMLKKNRNTEAPKNNTFPGGLY